MGFECTTCEDSGEIEVVVSCHSSVQIDPLTKMAPCPDCQGDNQPDPDLEYDRMMEDKYFGK